MCIVQCIADTDLTKGEPRVLPETPPVIGKIYFVVKTIRNKHGWAYHFLKGFKNGYPITTFSDPLDDNEYKQYVDEKIKNGIICR